MTFDIRAFLARIEGIPGNLPGFVAPLVGISLAILIALGVHALAFRLIVQRIDGRHSLTASLVRKSRRPLRLASALLALVLVMPMVRLPHAWERTLGHTALIVLIVLVGWTVILLLNHFTERSVSRYRFDVEDNYNARKHVTAPLEEMRRKVEEFVNDSALWDGDVINLQVTDTDKDTITVRALMSASNSPRASDLRCELREKMPVWLQRSHPGALPRMRGELKVADAPEADRRDADMLPRRAYSS